MNNRLVKFSFPSLFIMIILLCSQYTEATNGLFPTFAGGRQGGRAADIAVANDPSALNTNPAGIAFIPGKMVDFHFGVTYPSIQFNNNLNRAESDFELGGYASFGMVWDQPHQIFQVMGDPFVYGFGGETIPSSPPSRGQGFLTWNTSQIPKNITINFEGEGGVVSHIRVYATQAKSPLVLWQNKLLPQIPAGAEFGGIRASFEWQCSSANTVVLQAEGKQAMLNVNGPAAKWNKGYVAVAWGQKHIPAYALLSSKKKLRIRNLKIAYHYRFGSEGKWKNLYCGEGEIVPENLDITDNVLLASDEQRHVIDNNHKIVLPVKKTEGKITDIRVYYRYHLQTSHPHPYIKTTMPSYGHIKELHLPPGREDLKKRTIAREKADFELPHSQRPSGFKFGFGMYPQTGGRYNIKIATDLFPEGIDNRVDQAFLSLVPGLAYRFNDSFSIGIAFNANFYMFESDGLTAQSSLVLRGTPAGLPSGSLTFGEALKNTLDTEYILGEADTDRLFGYGFGGRAGFLWKLNDRFQIGAIYVPRTVMQSTQGKTLVDFTRHFQSNPIFGLLAGLTLPNQGQYGFASEYDMKLEFDLPQQAGFGFSWRILDNLMMAADFKWIDYSDTMNRIKLIFENGSNPDMDALATSRVEGHVQSGWKDQYVVAVGMVWQPDNDWTLRLGYNYGTNPVPKEYLNPQFPGFMEHHVMAGTSYRPNSHILLSSSIEWGLPATLKSGDVNKYHPRLTNSELKIYTLAALLSVDFNF